MVGRLIIDNKDAYTQWGVLFLTLDGLTMPKRKKAYSKSWESGGEDVIWGGYESRSLSLTVAIEAATKDAVRAAELTFCTMLQDADRCLFMPLRNEGAVVRYEDVASRELFATAGGKWAAVLKIKLVDSYPTVRILKATPSVTTTVSFTVENYPLALFWGDGTKVIQRTATASKSLAAGTYYIFICASTDFDPVLTVTNCVKV